MGFFPTKERCLGSTPVMATPGFSVFNLAQGWGCIVVQGGVIGAVWIKVDDICKNMCGLKGKVHSKSWFSKTKTGTKFKNFSRKEAFVNKISSGFAS